MRFPSVQLADEALELQLEMLSSSEVSEEQHLRKLPELDKIAKKENVEIGVVQMAVHERIVMAISISARQKKQEGFLDFIAWMNGEFSAEVRNLLAELLGLDAKNARFQSFAKKLAEEFGTWSETNLQGMQDLRLLRDDGKILSTIGKPSQGTKMRHKE